MPLLKNRDFAWMAALVALGAAMRLALFNGLYGHDDWIYLFYTRSFLNGQTDELLHSLWGLRFLLWMPIAVVFKLFGASYAGAFLPGFLCGLASIPLAYACIRKLGGSTPVAVAGGLVLLFNPIDWMVSSTIRGDIEMSFYGGLLLLLLLSFREAEGRRKLLLGIATGFVWGMSTLTKEWGFVFAWGFFAVALFDLVKNRRMPWAYATVGIGFALVLAIDTVVLHAATGEWMARVKTSLRWYQNVKSNGEALDDRSKELIYLPSILLGLHNTATDYNRFVNGYPDYGIYMWTLLIALPLSLCWRGPARPVAWFVAGVLLWIEFGSMSWSEYLPYHKEPRYFAMISVPLAAIVATAGARLWNSPSRRLRDATILAALGVAVVTTMIVRRENREYTKNRDFIPALVTWLESHPQARLWTSFSMQNEVDLRTHYRFSDPAHGHAGAPGYGTVMDIGLWKDRHRDGDYLLVHEGWTALLNLYPDMRQRYMEATPSVTLRGPTSTAMIYQVKATNPADLNMDYLSDHQPKSVKQGFGSLHFDRTVDGAPIILGGVQYETGLGTHANSDITYALDKQYSLFSTVVGVDDSTLGLPGTAIFEVWVDNRQVYKSPFMKAGDKPVTLRIDVTGAETLRLVANDGGDGNRNDHVDWAAAKLTKAP